MDNTRFCLRRKKVGKESFSFGKSVLRAIKCEKVDVL